MPPLRARLPRPSSRPSRRPRPAPAPPTPHAPPALRSPNSTSPSAASAVTSPNPEALANLRNAAGVAALDYRDLAALLVQPGSGLLGPLRLQGVAAYAQIDAAAAAARRARLQRAQTSGARCSTRSWRARRHRPDPILATAAPDGLHGHRSRPTAPARSRSTGAPRSPSCSDRPPCWAPRATTSPTSAGRPGARLRSAIDAAIAVLSAANHAVDHGANPAATTTRAFAQATAQLRDGFRSAGVVCAVPGA